MKHIVSFSGGRTSAYLVHLMEQKRKDSGWEVEYVFSDTGAEHPKTYDFIRQVVNHYGINLTILKAVVSSEKGIGIRYKIIPISEMGWDLSLMRKMVNVYGNFTINRPNCTSKIKSDCQERYKKDKYGKGNFNQWLGMRIDEPRRLKFINLNDDMFTSKKLNPNNIRYLAEISDFEKSDVLEWWGKMPFDLQIEEHLGNCVFCIKKSSKKIALAARDEPILFNDWNEAITGSHVRLMPTDKLGTGHIYRGWLSPDKLIAQFSDVPTSHLKEMVYKGKKNDVGSCSESCEIDFDQMDMFKEVSQ